MGLKFNHLLALNLATHLKFSRAPVIWLCPHFKFYRPAVNLPAKQTRCKIDSAARLTRRKFYRFAVGKFRAAKQILRAAVLNPHRRAIPRRNRFRENPRRKSFKQSA